MCPHTAINTAVYVFAYCYIYYGCVLILLYVLLYMCPHTAMYSRWSCVCVTLKDLKDKVNAAMCPHTVTYSRWPCVCVKRAERSERQSQCRERDDSGDAKLLVYEALTY
jgi:hypothetical protein